MRCDYCRTMHHVAIMLVDPGEDGVWEGGVFCDARCRDRFLVLLSSGPGSFQEQSKPAPTASPQAERT